MARNQSTDGVSIGKFDILATFAYVEALRHGSTDDEAKQRGTVVAILGAQIRLGPNGDGPNGTPHFLRRAACGQSASSFRMSPISVDCGRWG